MINIRWLIQCCYNIFCLTVPVQILQLLRRADFVFFAVFAGHCFISICLDFEAVFQNGYSRRLNSIIIWRVAAVLHCICKKRVDSKSVQLAVITKPPDTIRSSIVSCHFHITTCIWAAAYSNRRGSSVCHNSHSIQLICQVLRSLDILTISSLEIVHCRIRFGTAGSIIISIPVFRDSSTIIMTSTQGTVSYLVQNWSRILTAGFITDIGEMVAVVGSPFLMFPVNNANASQVNRNLPVAIMNLFTRLGYYCIKRIIFFISCSVAPGLVCLSSFHCLFHHFLICNMDASALIIAKRKHIIQIPESTPAEVITVRRNNTAAFWWKAIGFGSSGCAQRNCTIIAFYYICIFCSKSTDRTVCTFWIFNWYISNCITVSNQTGTDIFTCKTAQISISIEHICIHCRSIHFTIIDISLVTASQSAYVKSSVSLDIHDSITTHTVTADCTILNGSLVDSYQSPHINVTVTSDCSSIAKVWITYRCGSCKIVILPIRHKENILYGSLIFSNKSNRCTFCGKADSTDFISSAFVGRCKRCDCSIFRYPHRTLDSYRFLNTFIIFPVIWHIINISFLDKGNSL